MMRVSLRLRKELNSLVQELVQDSCSLNKKRWQTC